MKTKLGFIIIYSLLMIAVASLNSCGKKYDNDETSHLRSVKHRLMGTWQLQSITNVSYNNPYYPSQPDPVINSSWTETFGKDNVYSSTTGTAVNYQISGTKESIIFKNSQSQNIGAAPEAGVGIYVILKLTKTEFWYQAKSSNSQLVMECHCIKLE